MSFSLPDFLHWPRFSRRFRFLGEGSREVFPFFLERRFLPLFRFFFFDTVLFFPYLLCTNSPLWTLQGVEPPGFSLDGFFFLGRGKLR